MTSDVFHDPTTAEAEPALDLRGSKRGGGGHCHRLVDGGGPVIRLRAWRRGAVPRVMFGTRGLLPMGG